MAKVRIIIEFPVHDSQVEEILEYPEDYVLNGWGTLFTSLDIRSEVVDG